MASYREGRIHYARGDGMTNREHGPPITPGTLFDVGSITKQFTATAISMLVGCS